MESAGVTLVKGDLRGIVRARRLSRGTIAAFFLITEHRAHVLGALPYVLLLLCPLLHVFLHGRHGHGHNGDGTRQGRSSSGEGA